MRSFTDERILGEAAYIVKTGKTVRETAKIYGVSKSTVHKDVTYRLKKRDPALYAEVKNVLDVHLKERHIRGGIATKKKYESERKAKKSDA